MDNNQTGHLRVATLFGILAQAAAQSKNMLLLTYTYGALVGNGHTRIDAMAETSDTWSDFLTCV
jgi:hypothetical protein